MLGFALKGTALGYGTSIKMAKTMGFLFFFFFFPLTNASEGLFIYSTPKFLNANVEQAVKTAISQGAIGSTINPNATYKSGKFFLETIQSSNATIYISFYYYDDRFCSPSVIPALKATKGQALRQKFESIKSTLLDRMKGEGYGAAYVMTDHFQLGYTEKTAKAEGEDGCTKMGMFYNQSLNYCYGYSSMLLSHSPFSFLKPGCILRSPNHRYMLEMQQGCNLVLSDAVASRALWSSNSDQSGKDCYLFLQPDSNLVVYNGHNQPVWSSATKLSDGSAELVVQNDGNLVLYSTSSPLLPLWASHTAH